MADYTAINDSSAYFQTALYTGNGGTLNVVNNGNSDLQPSLVWLKERAESGAPIIFDSVRGVGKFLRSSTAAAQVTQADTLTAFNSDGFSLGADSADYSANQNSKTYVAWQFKGGTTASGTTGGSGTGKPYSYSASPASGFSAVTFTGNATAGHLIPHGMGKVPKMIHVKSIADDNGWHSGTSAAGGFNDHGYLYLENAFGTDANQFGGTHTTTNIRLGTGTGTNGNNGTRFAMCFADVQGYQKIGDYIGNGNTDGTSVYTGFLPAWVMIKKTSGTGDWEILDNKRLGFNGRNETLGANYDAAEGNYNRIDMLSNGFKVRSTSGNVNTSGGTYIYLAIAQNPFTTSTGVPTTAR